MLRARWLQPFRREAAEELAERCHAEVVQVIGRKFSLYRESSRKDIEKIKLV